MSRFLKRYLWIVGAIAVTTLGAAFFVFAAGMPSFVRSPAYGTYPCWSFNVGGRGGRCTSPPLVLQKNGTYSMSSERGIFLVKGNKITLSKSTVRGPGTISDDGMQIQFSYMYKGLQQTVTYLRRENASVPGPSVLLDLAIHYPSNDASLDYINVIQLIEKEGKDRNVYDAVAYDPDLRTLKAYFKKGVPGGQVYRVITSSGAERREVGMLDLRGVKGEVARTIETKTAVENPVVPNEGKM